ncbi:UDP-4-amino-4,6-dideoxy-N-acetyl-beta-L-altrosamine transaminase [Acinetobacter bereziniae]|uniref:UDP-4-amino-4, 6-dideoxy-N-acetyl-beta-L-altrosamine transaminase n=1 Tax=Acinetobacter bereziniae TaxID=106648 RepID=UPI00158011E3|nr:UDP-4-amino-4,6-dideoxy-N-acetyl-beta-L-altrosamine transaminase [Acinetobacter bereziniae]NUF65347.1 UDP-4-amino-4,6-dideoxy-N-acetyl-beta-L-altrosamine transaminase [Acinetobacter bereziniae]NUG09455.1 UDP-4-amino-4,6-dideoxy-N-acetyl-beta-L-altrosamine transaminase [Acinetobacter bereziniae]NUG65974.1 UDP-4-amino-4,6-dideoxy-N-acetyl-beta-L-altrosamine transaminase [Acinetobacter bereziniae]NUG71781.1 UDP-4-amino-4,6-dideoxy-N-acetyl-beta-L-altrosamine transaminase [Acinetobacter berezini
MFIPYGRQNINQADIDAVVQVLQSDFLTQGPQVPLFEKSIAELVGARYAFAMNSATSALHVACLALGLKQGDVLWTSPITFVASANCALYCGAEVDFVDIDRKTYNLSVDALKAKLEFAKQNNKLPKIVVPIHLCGQSCDMERIHALSLEYGFSIIEDASHAIGGKYKDNYIGSNQYSDITIFSFHPVKIITTAEGGMALTNNEELAKKIDLLRSHGVTRNPEFMNKLSEGPWYYQQVELGYNYRMTELQAALGISQIGRLEKFVAKRHEIAQIYNDKLKDLPIVLPYQLPETYSGLHLYVVCLKLELIKRTRKEVFEFLRAKGIGVNVHYIPVHTQPYYKSLGFKDGDFPNAEAYYSMSISLPMYPDLTIDQMDYICSTLKIILE